MTRIDGILSEARTSSETGMMNRLRSGIGEAHKRMCLADAWFRLRLGDDGGERGAATAEYAVVLVAATGFAGLLAVVLKSDSVKTLLTGIVKKALNV
mgnify:CR=1 FL=1